jgi:hypothetical protein
MGLRNVVILAINQRSPVANAMIFFVGGIWVPRPGLLWRPTSRVRGSRTPDHHPGAMLMRREAMDRL